jgi:hypothetical protein
MSAGLGKTWTKHLIVWNSLVGFFVVAVWWLSAFQWAADDQLGLLSAAVFLAFGGMTIVFWITELPQQRRRRQRDRVATAQRAERLAEHCAAGKRSGGDGG